MENEQTNTQNTTTAPVDSVLTQAEKLAARIEEANRKTEELIKRQEALKVQNLLGGSSVASSTPPPQAARPDTPKEYAQKILKGLKA